MTIRLPFVLALALFTAAGCANYSQLQGAETMRAGQTGIGVGASFTRYETDLDDDGDTDSVSVPALVIAVRRGLTEQLEVQATAWLPLGARAGVKYQLLGTTGETGLHVSVGGHVGYLNITSGDGANEVSSKFVDVYVPLYVGYRLATSLEVYGVPQYILRSVLGDGGTSIGHVAGGVVGLAIGSKTKFYLEGGASYDTLYNSPIVSTAIGVGF
jgi:hypothetical protein